MDLEQLPFKQKIKVDFKLKIRDEHMKELSSEEYDLLIIGGGANGTGVALDAANR